MSKHDCWPEGERAHYVDWVMVERITNARRTRHPSYWRLLNRRIRRMWGNPRRPLPDRRQAA